MLDEQLGEMSVKSFDKRLSERLGQGMGWEFRIRLSDDSLQASKVLRKALL